MLQTTTQFVVLDKDQHPIGIRSGCPFHSESANDIQFWATAAFAQRVCNTFPNEGLTVGKATLTIEPYQGW